MHEHKRDLKLSFAAFLIVVCMLLPALVNLSHAIHGHDERTCSSDIASHFHKTEFDCEFQKYKLNKQFYADLHNDGLFVPLPVKKAHSSTYNYLISHRQLHFSLRAPPAGALLQQSA